MPSAIKHWSSSVSANSNTCCEFYSAVTGRIMYTLALFARTARCYRRVTSLAPLKTGIQSLQQLRCKSYPGPQVKLNLDAAVSRPILARSWLFSAKSKYEIKKAVTLGADVIILDMEDSVPGNRKEEMRKEYRTALDDGIFANACVYVRVNETSCLSDLEKDVDALTQRDVAGFILPKTESENDIHLLEEMVLQAEVRSKLTPGKLCFVPIVETPRAYFHLDKIASSSPRLSAIIMGNGDLAARVLCEDHSPTYYSFFSRGVLAAKAAGIEAIGGVHDKIDDIVGFEKFCNIMKRCGFVGVVTLTPKQLALANRAFSYTSEELQWAQKVVGMGNTHNGQIKTIQRSIQESRQMIGPPHYLKANAILDRSHLSRERLSHINKSNQVISPTHPSQTWLDPTLKVGEMIYSPLEVTVTESWKTMWDSAFLSMGELQNSYVKSSKLGLPDVPLPFSLLATMVAGFTVSMFSYDARVHLGFYNLFQNRPVFPGDTLHAMFCVDSASDTTGKDGNRYTIAHSSHWLVNQKNQVVFSAQKRTMFAPRKVKQCTKPTVNSQALAPSDSIWRKMVVQQPTESLLSRAPQPTLVPGELFIHSHTKVHDSSEMRMLASLMRITNPHHHNTVRYLPTDILVPGPFVMAAAIANTTQNLGEVAYEDIPMAANLNKVNPGDLIGTVSYVLDSKHLADNPDLEQVTIRHLAIKNTNIEELQNIGIPQKLLNGSLTKPSEYESVCQNECPLLFHKIACHMVRRLIRVSPEVLLQYQKDRKLPEELHF